MSHAKLRINGIHKLVATNAHLRLGFASPETQHCGVIA